MNKKNKPKYSVIKNILFLVKDMAKAHPLLIFFLLLEMTLSVISPVLNLYVPKVALELVTNKADKDQILLSLGFIGLAMTLSMALSGMAGEGKFWMYHHMRLIYQYRLFLQSLDCDYANIESVDGRTKYARAVEPLMMGDSSGICKMIVFALDIFIATATFVIYSTIISTLNIFIVAVLVFLSFINFFAVRHAQSFEQQNRNATATLSRQMNYVESVSNDWRFGKDIRLYHMGDWLLSVKELLLKAHTALNQKIRNRYFAAGTINALTLFLRDSLAYGYLIFAASTGRITIGDFVLYFGAVTGFSSFFGRIISDINELNGANLQLNDLRAFLDNTDAPSPESPAPVPTKETLSIEFSHVYFSYSKGSKPILRDFCMKIHPGEKIALVGVNGAGKTTIIKLLCGFYKPDSGKILIDNININQYRKEDLYTLFSTVFQDIFIPPFTVAENVSMQPLDKTDMARVEVCLRQAGIYDEIYEYPDNTRSYMLKEIHDGIMLSGGQQQKLLLARALYKDAPILILDEPTAALDPIAESETYESFHKLSLQKTSIFISHRLASTRFCDRILFLQDGTVKENGSHEELLSLGGNYAQMYELQSHYYKEEGGSLNA